MHTYSICFQLFPFKRRLIANKTASFKVLQLRFACPVTDTDTIVEIKSVISLNANALFPTVYSERTLKQLRKLQELLKQGKKVCFFVVSLHPYVTEITLNRNSDFYNELSRCVELGMKLVGFSCRLRNGKMKVEKEICIH